MDWREVVFDTFHTSPIKPINKYFLRNTGCLRCDGTEISLKQSG